MRHSRWLFFDLGNTLISEEAATEARIQQLVDSFERYGRRSSVEDVRSAFQQASREFAPRLITRVIEKLSNDPKRHRLILAESRYPKELEAPYEGVAQSLRALSSRYRIGVIANQPLGTVERLTRWGLMPFISLCLSSAEEGVEKPNRAIFELALSRAGCTAAHAVMIGDRLDNDIRPAKLLGWRTMRVTQGFARFQSPRDGWDEADRTVVNVNVLVPDLMGGC
jgi:HAD superfamily hydrolase (TIGR01549 family)